MSKLSEFLEADRKKIGGLTAGSMARLGLAELRQAVALDGSVAEQTPTPLGMYGTATPGEISTARRDETAHGAAESAEVDPVTAARQSAAAQAASAAGRERDGRDADR